MEKGINVVMKKLTLIIFILFCASFANAANMTWDASTSGGVPTGYKIYYTDGTNNYSVDVGNVLTVIDVDSTFNLVTGKTYTFKATAYNDVEESGFSNQVNYNKKWNRIRIGKDIRIGNGMRINIQ